MVTVSKQQQRGRDRYVVSYTDDTQCRCRRVFQAESDAQQYAAALPPSVQARRHSVARRKGQRETATQILVRRTYVDQAGCWIWTGPIDREGYGRIPRSYTKGSGLAHRAAYAIFCGPLEPGLTIDHLCRNRRCCNPNHLEQVSIGENLRRSPYTFAGRKLRGAPSTSSIGKVLLP